MKSAGTLAAAALALAAFAAPAWAQLDAAKADAIMKKGACSACHSIDKKGVGPAYKEVAKKRKGEANAATVVAEKVRKGGAGVYGPVPMPPNGPDKISDDDLAQLVGWILAQ
jgi:cytochrome c